MNIKEAKEELCRTVKAYTAKNEAGLYLIPQVRRRPILLMGAPGIGKTAIVSQAAAACGVAFLSYTMTHHTRQSAIGLPVIKEHSFHGASYSMTEYTMSEIIGSVHKVIEETGMEEGILFLDEINCVSETLLPTMLQLLQFKTFGTHSLPEGWVIAAAGNPPRYNRSAREFDMVTMDRVKYMELEPDLDTWLEYAVARRVHDSILSYLRLRPEHFYLFSRTERGREFVTPRSWEDLSEALKTYEILGLTVEDSFFPQYLQSMEVSSDFSAYYRLYKKLLETCPLQSLLGLSETGSGSASAEAFPDVPGAPKTQTLLPAAWPADERFCLIGQLSAAVRRQTGEFEDKRLLLQSLSYFADGLAARLSAHAAAASDSSSAACLHTGFSGLCSSLLESRREALKKKKEFGLLASGEEERELLLAQKVKAYASRIRLERAAGAAPGTADADDTSRLKSLIAQEQTALDSRIPRLKRFLLAASGFISREFSDGLETCLFASELLGSPETAKFLETHLNELYETLKEQAGA